VVGNPPWVQSKFMDNLPKNFWEHYFTSMIKQFDIYNGFIEKAIQNSTLEARLSYILASRFLANQDYVPLRRVILSNTKILKICNVGEGAFEMTSMPSAILVISKTMNKNGVIEIEEMDREKVKCIGSQSQENLQPPLFLLPYESDQVIAIIDKLESWESTFGDFVNNARGVEIGKESSLIVNEKQKGTVKFLLGEHVERYAITGHKYLQLGKAGIDYKDAFLYTPPKIIVRKTGDRINATLDNEGICVIQVIYIFKKKSNISIPSIEKYLLSILNSCIITFWYFKRFGQAKQKTFPHITQGNLLKTPIPPATPDQQAPIITLVDAIIQKKKEYHAISQNIEDYIDFGKANLIRLDEFLKGALDDFDVVSSLKVKHDNFDALRLRIKENKAILEYGIRRKVEDYEEIEEDEQTEVKGKYVVEWHPAGEGKIKDRLAIEFLAKMLEKEKRFSKAKTKTMWQKIAEVKVPEFTSEVKEGFLKYKSLIEKAKELDKEITKIDRAIDRLVYNLYGLTEDEIKIVEKSVWGDKYEEMYEKLPSRNDVLKLAEEVKE